jgi:hypothetical protein
VSVIICSDVSCKTIDLRQMVMCVCEVRGTARIALRGVCLVSLVLGSGSLVLCCENITKRLQIQHWGVTVREGFILISPRACSVLCKILLLSSENCDFWSIQNFTIKNNVLSFSG